MPRSLALSRGPYRLNERILVKERGTTKSRRNNVDLNLFKQNIVRLRSELETAEHLRALSQAKRNHHLEGCIANARAKADWLLSEIEIAEGEQLLAKIESEKNIHA